MQPFALTGPAAAALHGLDGFRDHDWDPLWCAPITTPYEPGLIRTRLWYPPKDIDDWLVVPPRTALRHLHTVPDTRQLSALDRIELATEHAILRGDVALGELVAGGGRQPGDALLRQFMARRPPGEPPTESYAETRAVQRMRAAGIVHWRQVQVPGSKHRADFLLPFRPMRRPQIITPLHGVLLECDSREHHEHRFEEDHARETTYDALAFRWLSFTPTQIERDWRRVEAVIRRVVAAGYQAPKRRRSA